MPIARKILIDKVVSAGVWRSRACLGAPCAAGVPALLPHLSSGAWQALGAQQKQQVRAVHLQHSPPTAALQHLKWGSLQPPRGGYDPLQPFRGGCSPPAAPYSISAFRQVLPRLPVPQLKETLLKYLKSVQPLVTGEELANTRHLVEDFLKEGGVGERLQQHLQQRAATKENWMSEWWLDSAYLQFRQPVVVWSSPGLVFPLVEFSSTQQQLAYAARLIAGALDYKRLLDSGEVAVDKSGGAELDMSQYDRIFSTCRVPGLTKDSLVFHSRDPQPPRHLVVMHNNHFFKLEVYGKKDQLLSASQLEAQLANILERSTRPAVPLGLLTTQHRNVWGQAYRTLVRADKRNAANVQEIQRSLFVLCLDSVVPPSSGNPSTDAALACVHGGGTAGNSGNRWFDKTIQFVVGASGRVGLTYEHSPAEGPPIANLMDHIVDYMSSDASSKALPAAQLKRPERLEFTVPAELEAEVHQAGTVLDSLVGDLQMTCFLFPGYGKAFMKAQGVSPDSFIQMAIQLAFYRIHGEPAAHYESASTRKFLHGRTETIRSCSSYSLDFCVAMADPSAATSIRRDALLAAVRSHNAYAKEAVDGRGVDRHLLGLKLAAVELGMDVPPLFMDVAYVRSAHMRLSTSQVPARCEAFMCYGPLVPDGYGCCCYNPRPDSIVFGVSALNSSPETDSDAFREALESSLLDMKDLLASAPKAA